MHVLCRVYEKKIAIVFFFFKHSPKISGNDLSKKKKYNTIQNNSKYNFLCVGQQYILALKLSSICFKDKT